MPEASESMTCNVNFKTTALAEKTIRKVAAEAGQSTSEFLRDASSFWADLVRECPAVTDLNRSELAELAANIGKRLVIQARVSFKGDEGVA